MDDFKLEHPLPYDFHPQDFYATPAWVTELLIKHAPPTRDKFILDPCAGNGAIVKVFHSHGYGVAANEIRVEEQSNLVEICGMMHWSICDFLSTNIFTYLNRDDFSIITNPPFSIGTQIANRCLNIESDYIALLLRIDVIGSENWRVFFTKHRPTKILPITKRPSFTGDGNTDFYNYGWFIWDSDRPSLDIVPVRPE